MEPILTREPLPCFFICVRTTRAQSAYPPKWLMISFSKSCCGCSSKGRRNVELRGYALFTQPSILPNSFTIESTTDCTDFSSVMSMRHFPCPRSSVHAMSAEIAVAPHSRRRFTMVLPRSPCPPVTTMIFPVRSISGGEGEIQLIVLEQILKEVHIKRRIDLETGMRHKVGE